MQISKFQEILQPSHSRTSFSDKHVLTALKENIQELHVRLPSGWGVHNNTNIVTISRVVGNIPKIDRAVVVDNCNANVYLNGIFRSVHAVQTFEDVLNIVNRVEDANLCLGTGISDKRSHLCNGENKQKKTERCKTCAALRKNLLRDINRKTKSTLQTNLRKKNKKQLYLRLKRKEKRQTKTITEMSQILKDQDKIENIINKLPENQQMVVRTCFETVGRPVFGKRYSKEWIYTCILLKIKSPKLYRHMRTRELLPLPAPSTLSNYIRNIDSAYGFQNKLFELLKEKTKNMTEFERHGTIMVDECKITPSKHFDKNRLEVIGFVDLGDYTPNNQQNQLGDHVLVFMFQSFVGKNIQALACFLSKGSVSGPILAKLVLEAVLLCEAAGLFVDVVTSDGATWNRNMWKSCSAENPDAPWTIHPANPKRKLRMCSDFPHLLKCIRNRLVAKKELHVPEGCVRLSHFQKLIEYDAKHEFKLAYKLTRKHVNPENHEKMRTRYAFQLFSGTVADALTILKEKGIPGFADCEPTVQFCRRLNQISDILNSNNCFDGLKLNSKEHHALEDFLLYLELWESCTDPQFFLTKSTYNGLRATINTTLDLLRYCSSELGFRYLMTSRINQDPLEHFFGLLRSSGGDNNNPESIQVAQIFRLLSLYSLIKPAKGSNVSGSGMLNVLINNSDMISNKDRAILTKQEMDLRLDQALEEDIESGTAVQFNDNMEAFAYVCGFIARKHKKEKCQDCIKTLIGEGLESYNEFIILRSRGHLTFPSAKLITLLQEVEIIISPKLQEEVRKTSLIDILNLLCRYKVHNLIGCEQHTSEMTKKILYSFLITRLSISCKKEARKRAAECSQQKRLSKLSKLV